MSGIATIVHFDDRPVLRTQIDNLVGAIAWRGPDHQGCWLNGQAAVGAVQLWTTHEDWGVPQPLVTPQGKTVALDGRIDNRADLARSLNIPNNELTEMSDVALVAAAFEKWGVASADHLAGAYAFVVWDAVQQELVCIRDPMGARSFFYHWDGRHFHASSTIHSLRALPNVHTTLNDDYIWDYLTTSFSGSYDPEATPFHEIQRVPAGHFLRLTKNGPKITRYWKPWELPKIDYKQDAEYANHLRELFEEVVIAYCRSKDPVAIALSGGLDSSSIVGVARELKQVGKLPTPDVHTYTLIWENASESLTGFTDGDFAEQVVKRHSGKTHYLICDGMTMFDHVPHRGPVPQDEPHFHLYTPWSNLERELGKNETRVLLTGVGADEGMAGSVFFIVDWLKKGRVRDALRVVKYIAQVTPHTYAQVLFNLVLAGLGPRSLAHFLHEKQPRHSSLTLNTRFHARTASWLQDDQRAFKRSLKRHKLIPKTFKDIAGRAQFEPGVLLAGDNSKLWSDQYLGLPAQVDQRYPYYDRRLMEFFARIPTIQKIGRNGERKSVMRRAMEGTLPNTIRYRKGNTDYGFIFRDGLNKNWQAFQSLFENSHAEAAGFINGKSFLSELNARRHGSALFTDADLIPTIGLEFWLREIEQ